MSEMNRTDMIALTAIALFGASFAAETVKLDFLPESQNNYEAKTKGYKDYWVCHGAVHANSFAKDPVTYKAEVWEFLDKVKRFIANGTYPDGDIPVKPSGRK